MDQVKTGKLIRSLRQKKSLTQLALAEMLGVSDGGWAVTSEHEMLREHYISFLTFLTGDTVMVKKLYPEWGLETWLPFFAHGRLLWCCTEHELFYQDI